MTLPGLRRRPHFRQQCLLAGFYKKLSLCDWSVGQNAMTKIENVTAASERIDRV